MANQTAVLERIAKPKCVAEEITGSLIIDCMHAIPLSRGVYRAIQRREVDEYACKRCLTSVPNQQNTSSSGGSEAMECPNCRGWINKAKQKQVQGNFYYRKDCGTVVAR